MEGRMTKMMDSRLNKRFDGLTTKKVDDLTTKVDDLTTTMDGLVLQRVSHLAATPGAAAAPVEIPKVFVAGRNE